MSLQFKNQDVAVKYESDRVNDPIVHLPGGKMKNGWKGRLSEIPLAQADRWISQKNQNLLKLKPAAPAAKAAKEASKEKD